MFSVACGLPLRRFGLLIVLVSFSFVWFDTLVGYCLTGCLDWYCAFIMFMVGCSV